MAVGVTSAQEDVIRPVSRGMRAFLYAAIALTFAAGTQLVVLAADTDRYFAWSIDTPMSAVFIGSSFWAASAVLTWSARQTAWVHARVPVPSVAVVATLLLIATVQHLELFESLLGFLWIEVYAIVPPLAVALVVMQLALPGTDPPPEASLPSGLKAALGVHAVALLGFGGFLYFGASDSNSIWPWELTDLTSKAVGTWLLGIGTLAGYVALRNDRADIPGASLSYLILPAMLTLGLIRFPDDVDFGSLDTLVFLLFIVSAAGIGAYGSLLSWREGRFASDLPHGGVPVEIKRPSGVPVEIKHPSGAG
jgi:hypothetical protein